MQLLKREFGENTMTSGILKKKNISLYFLTGRIAKNFIGTVERCAMQLKIVKIGRQS